MKQCSEEGLVE